MLRVVNAVEDPALKDMAAFSIRRRQPGALTSFKLMWLAGRHSKLSWALITAKFSIFEMY